MIKRKIKTKVNAVAGNPARWKFKLLNTPCFLLGNGPSISGQPLHLLENHFTIGINKAFKLIDPTLLMWQDIEFWYTDHKQIRKLKAIKYCRNVSDPKSKFVHFSIRSGAFKLPNNPKTLYGRGATGPLAFQLAWVLGCNPIVLLGMDCKYQGDKTDFYGKNPFHKPHTLKNCNKGLKWIRSWAGDMEEINLKQCPYTLKRNIISCSEDDVFDKHHTLEEAIELCKPNTSKESSRKYFNDLLGM
tara:strand:- start:114 stop:845 length:732 start_codon:yes stop_codon:yes gene_type:complete